MQRTDQAALREHVALRTFEQVRPDRGAEPRSRRRAGAEAQSCDPSPFAAATRCERETVEDAQPHRTEEGGRVTEKPNTAVSMIAGHPIPGERPGDHRQRERRHRRRGLLPQPDQTAPQLRRRPAARPRAHEQKDGHHARRSATSSRARPPPRAARPGPPAPTPRPRSDSPSAHAAHSAPRRRAERCAPTPDRESGASTGDAGPNQPGTPSQSDPFPAHERPGACSSRQPRPGESTSKRPLAGRRRIVRGTGVRSPLRRSRRPPRMFRVCGLWAIQRGGAKTGLG